MPDQGGDIRTEMGVARLGLKRMEFAEMSLKQYLVGRKALGRGTMGAGQEESPVRLTTLSHGSGCGCKLSPTELESVLAEAFPKDAKAPSFAGLVIGNDTKDDAAVYDIGCDDLLVATTDFFTPVLDDAYQYGRVAAANALSDIYAMGGQPLLALAVLGWPVEQLDPAMARPILAGGKAVCDEVGIPLAGGHSIDSIEPFFGLAVNGLVHRDRLRTNAGAKDGDWVFLTKPIGTGLLSTAEKYGILRPGDAGIAARIMGQLNSIGYDLAAIDAVHAMTDVTGFGLLGHLIELCEASGLAAELAYGAVRLPTDLTHYVASGALAKGLKNNWRSYSDKVTPLVEPVRSILCDPQTGGGLLVAVSDEGRDQVTSLLRDRGLDEHTEPIARLKVGTKGRLVIRVHGHEDVPESASLFGLDAAAHNERNRIAAEGGGRGSVGTNTRRDGEADSDTGDATESVADHEIGGVSRRDDDSGFVEASGRIQTTGWSQAPGRIQTTGHVHVPTFNAECAPPRPSVANPRETWKMMKVFGTDLVRYRREIRKHAEWIHRFADRNGYRVNPHWMMNTNLRLWLVESEETFGKRYCPCFEPSDDDALNRTLVCPCRYMDKDIATKGTCHCVLFGRGDLTDDGFTEAEARLSREYRVELRFRGDMLDTTGIPTDPFRGLKIPDAYHLTKRGVMLRGLPLHVYVERDFEARNIELWAQRKGISTSVRPDGEGLRVSLGLCGDHDAD